jgi:hypothetical protein
VFFTDPQRAINRYGYISESKYGVPRVTGKNKKRNWEQTDKVIPCLLRILSFDM